MFTVKTIAITLILSTTLASGAALAQAPRDVATQTVVTLSESEDRSPQAVKATYKRLRKAAQEVCASGMSRNLAAAASDRACARDALDKAVAAADRAALSRYHAEQTGQSDRALASN